MQDQFPPGAVIKYFKTLQDNLQLKTFFEDYQLACFVITTKAWDPICEFKANSFVPDVLKGTFRPITNASEEINSLGNELLRVFPQEKCSRRCVLVVSNQCSPPKDQEPWKNIWTDVILVGPKPTSDISRAWQTFCSQHKGRVCIVNDSHEHLGFYLRQLTHPLVVSLDP